MGFISNAKDDPEASKYYIGFPKGLNTAQNESSVDDKNLTEAQNAIIEIDGVSPRPGTLKVFNEADANFVYGQGTFNNIQDSIIQHIRIGNAKLQYRANQNETWSSISSPSYTNTRTTFVQARNKIFIHNGVDNLTSYDGTSVSEYTAITAPTGLGITVTGSSGSTSYSYEVTAFNQHAETNASTVSNTTTGNATLSSTNYNALAWTVVSGATGYNVYGRKATGWGRVFLATVYTNSYNDTGDAVETYSKVAPTSNATGGIKAKLGIFSSLGRQFCAGVTEDTTYYPTRLYYSGTAQYVDTFAGAEFGGGWVEIASADGGEIVDIKPYQSSVLIWKTNGIYRFYFTSNGSPAVVEITKDHGGCSFWGSQEVGNDYIYLANIENRIAVMTLGEQANFSAGSIRANEISIFIREDLKAANRQYINNIASFKFDSKFGFTFTAGNDTQNSRGYLIDTRFGGFVYWDGDPMECGSYHVHNDGLYVYLYGSSNTDGYVTRLFQSERNDSGNAFRTIIGTKSFNFDMFDVDKIFRNPILWFKYIRGGEINLEIWTDGTLFTGTAVIGSENTGAGVGVYLTGEALPGDLSGDEEITSLGDVPIVVETMQTGRSVKFYLISEQINSNWLFMGLRLQASILEGKPLNDRYRTQLNG